MKKSIILLTLFLFASFCKADQLAYITKDQALKATEYIRGQSTIIMWCACCEGNNPKQIVTVSNVYYEATGTEEFYHVMLEGTDNNNKNIKEELDLAYVHVNKNGMAVCLGKELGLKCDPCTQPFPYPSAKPVSNNSSSTTFDGVYIDKFGNKITIEEIEGGEKIKYTLTGSVSTNCVNTEITGTAEIFRVNMKGADPNYNGPEFWFTDVIDKCNIDIEPVNYGKSVKVNIRNCKDTKCASDNGFGNVYTKK